MHNNIILNQLPNRITSPSWWQLINWIADPIKLQDRYSQKYGDIFTMRLSGLGSYVVIGNPQVIMEIFNQDSKFDIGRGNALAEPLIGKNSLMLLGGGPHQRERKLLMPPFHGKRIEIYSKQICLITEQVTSQWQIDRPFLLRTDMQKISLEIILQIVFGLSEEKYYKRLKLLLKKWLDMSDSLILSSMLFVPLLQQDWGGWTPWGKVMRRQNQVHKILQEEIEHRRIKGNKKKIDVLSLLMAARDENGLGMTDEQIKDELVSILFAGYETLATSITWAFYQIYQRLEVYEKLLQEVKNDGTDLSPLEIAQLPYLTAVCQETLRMYPIFDVIFPRITKSSVNIAGYQFDSETKLLPSIYLVHYREDLYPNAQKFEPERFLLRHYSPYEYFPFGGGSRRCLGYALAKLEMKLVIATILSKYRLNLVDKENVKIKRRGFFLAPSSGIRMVMTAKQSKA